MDFQTFLQQFVNALSLGSLYALTALGFNMIFGILRMMIFAHGEIFMAGALICATLNNVAGMSVLPAALIAALLQLFYMGASIASGIAAAWVSPRNMVRLTIVLSPVLLAMAVATPWVLPFALCLALVSACAVSTGGERCKNTEKLRK